MVAWSASIDARERPQLLFGRTRAIASGASASRRR
jgi:hypothetical protein